MPTDREALIAAIVANPGDDTPRLVYADWLEEYGSEAERGRGQFIRLQCQLAKELNRIPRFCREMKYEFDNLWEELIAQGREDLIANLDHCRDLHNEHAEEWEAELPAMKNVTYHRGFPTLVEIEVPVFVQAGEQFLRTNPIERVHLSQFHTRASFSPASDLNNLPETERRAALRQRLNEFHRAESAADRSPGVAAIALCPHLAHVRHLDISVNELTGSNVAALLASEHLGELRALTVGSNIGPVGAEAIAQCPKLCRVEELRLHFGRIQPQGMQAIARSPYLGQVRKINLYANQLGDAGIAALATAQSLRNVETLDIGYNGIGVVGLRLFVHSVGLPRLKDLAANANRFGDAGCEILAGSPLASRLTKLKFGTNNLTAAGIRWLASAPFAGLEELELEVPDNFPNPIGPGGAGFLSSSPHLAKLRILNLKQTGLGDEGAIAFARGAGLSGLKDLILDRNDIRLEGARALAGSSQLAKLHRLSLERNQIGPEGAAALATSPHLSHLRRLNLDKCQIGDEGVFALVQAQWFSGLTWVNLSGNELTDRGAIAVVESPAFARMNMFGLNGVGDITAAAIARSPRSANLRRLSLGANVTDEGYRELAASPHLERLEVLNLGENKNTTSAGRQSLWRRFGKRVLFGLGRHKEEAEFQEAISTTQMTATD